MNGVVLNFLENMWPLVAFGAAGKIIDFYLGHGGQAYLKKWLKQKWEKFETVRLSDFSQKEAMYYIRLSDRIFGARLLSWRRLFSSFLVYFVCFCFSVSRGSISYDLDSLVWWWRYLVLVRLVLPIALFMLSISLTRWLSVRVIKLTSSRSLGMLPYAVLMGVHLFLFFYWRPAVDLLVSVSSLMASRVRNGDWPLSAADVKTLLGFYLIPDSFGYLLRQSPKDLAVTMSLTLALMPYVAYGIRILVALAILVAFSLRTWIGAFVSLTWKRVIEDKKPAITLLFGAIGAVFGALNVVFDHLQNRH